MGTLDAARKCQEILSVVDTISDPSKMARNISDELLMVSRIIKTICDAMYGVSGIAIY
uniref:Uncharacterized protein n=1 Tax=Cucumis melo TaxID=3656 RepID=A0A9I9DWA6_CUCME